MSFLCSGKEARHSSKRSVVGKRLGYFLVCTLKQYGETWGVEVGGYKRGTISAINNNREAC